ncbi:MULTISPECIES: hypothetical protein [Streptomyces]|uniref:hypothetical protein n=1 Tax=Streptomyces TaxID=1883 RepID=UPI001489DD45|nr:MULTISPECIES: hypothetical protein [Streptomyces]
MTTASVDTNGKRTDAVHDGLGRVIKVWLPGWSKSGHAGQPSAEYTYKVSKTAANAVATKTLRYVRTPPATSSTTARIVLGFSLAGSEVFPVEIISIAR